MAEQKRRPRLPFAVALYAAGITQAEFARLYGCTGDFVNAVAAGRAPAPERFRELASQLLGETEDRLFPSQRTPLGVAS